MRASSNSPNGEGKNLPDKEKDGLKIDYSGEKPATPLLDTVNFPIHMKNLSMQVNLSFLLSIVNFSCILPFFVPSYYDYLRSFFQDLEKLAAELRAEIVFSVSKTGGHLSASLGVVELAVALHHVFNTPDDKIIWDVGHQVHIQQKCYNNEVYF